MRIIIVGCGKVGSELAGQLSAAGHDLTLIDLSERRLDELSNTYDLATVKGSGTSYHVLREAGVQDTDLLIAVTTHDEINLLSCLIARKASGCHAIARVRDPEYVSDLGFIRDELGISMVINPSCLRACCFASDPLPVGHQRQHVCPRTHRAARPQNPARVPPGRHGGLRGQSSAPHGRAAVHGPPRRSDLYPEGRLHPARKRQHHGYHSAP